MGQRRTTSLPQKMAIDSLPTGAGWKTNARLGSGALLKTGHFSEQSPTIDSRPFRDFAADLIEAAASQPVAVELLDVIPNLSLGGAPENCGQEGREGRRMRQQGLAADNATSNSGHTNIDLHDREKGRQPQNEYDALVEKLYHFIRKRRRTRPREVPNLSVFPAFSNFPSIEVRTFLNPSQCFWMHHLHRRREVDQKARPSVDFSVTLPPESSNSQAAFVEDSLGGNAKEDRKREGHPLITTAMQSVKQRKISFSSSSGSASQPSIASTVVAGLRVASGQRSSPSSFPFALHELLRDGPYSTLRGLRCLFGFVGSGELSLHADDATAVPSHVALRSGLNRWEGGDSADVRAEKDGCTWQAVSSENWNNLQSASKGGQDVLSGQRKELGGWEVADFKERWHSNASTSDPSPKRRRVENLAATLTRNETLTGLEAALRLPDPVLSTSGSYTKSEQHSQGEREGMQTRPRTSSSIVEANGSAVSFVALSNLVEARRVRLSKNLRALGCEVRPENSTVYIAKGCGSVLATHCTDAGRYYFEVTILSPFPRTPPGGCIDYDTMGNLLTPLPRAAIRVGWATANHNLRLPLGASIFSVGLSCNEGSFVARCAGGVPYAIPAKPGDTVGCFLSLSPNRKRTSSCGKLDQAVDGERTCAHYPNHFSLHRFEAGLQGRSLGNRRIHDLNGDGNFDEAGFVQFSINGKFYGASIAVDASPYMLKEQYHPAVTLMDGARCQVNFGPTFRCPPPQNSDNEYMPACNLPLQQSSAYSKQSGLLNGLPCLTSRFVVDPDRRLLRRETVGDAIFTLLENSLRQRRALWRNPTGTYDAMRGDDAPIFGKQMMQGSKKGAKRNVRGALNAPIEEGQDFEPSRSCCTVERGRDEESQERFSARRTTTHGRQHLEMLGNLNEETRFASVDSTQIHAGRHEGATARQRADSLDAQKPVFQDGGRCLASALGSRLFWDKRIHKAHSRYMKRRKTVESIDKYAFISDFRFCTRILQQNSLQPGCAQSPSTTPSSECFDGAQTHGLPNQPRVPLFDKLMLPTNAYLSPEYLLRAEHWDNGSRPVDANLFFRRHQGVKKQGRNRKAFGRAQPGRVKAFPASAALSYGLANDATPVEQAARTRTGRQDMDLSVGLTGRCQDDSSVDVCKGSGMETSANFIFPSLEEDLANEMQRQIAMSPAWRHSDTKAFPESFCQSTAEPLKALSGAEEGKVLRPKNPSHLRANDDQYHIQSIAKQGLDDRCDSNLSAAEVALHPLTSEIWERRSHLELSGDAMQRKLGKSAVKIMEGVGAKISTFHHFSDLWQCVVKLRQQVKKAQCLKHEDSAKSLGCQFWMNDFAPKFLEF